LGEQWIVPSEDKGLHQPTVGVKTIENTVLRSRNGFEEIRAEGNLDQNWLPRSDFTLLVPPKPDSFLSADVTSGRKAGMEVGKARTDKSNYVDFLDISWGRKKRRKLR